MTSPTSNFSCCKWVNGRGRLMTSFLRKMSIAIVSDRIKNIPTDFNPIEALWIFYFFERWPFRWWRHQDLDDVIFTQNEHHHRVGRTRKLTPAEFQPDRSTLNFWPFLSSDVIMMTSSRPWKALGVNKNVVGWLHTCHVTEWRALAGGNDTWPVPRGCLSQR